ncbi:DNA polymerase III subunit beta [Patescibacteria group bacterium]
MKVKILQENLHKSLSLAERFVAARPQLPILSNILLKADSSGFYVVATNLETGIRYRVGAKIEKEGSLTVPAKTFFEFVGNLPSETVSLVVEDEQLKATCANFSASFQGISSTEYPDFPEKGKEEESEISLKVMNEIIDKVGFAASSDDSRPVLTGMFWDLGKSSSKIAATDGYRLSLLNISTKELGGRETLLLLPSQVLRDVGKVFTDISSEKIKVSWSDKQKQVFFISNDLEVVTRVLEGEYPNYKAVIPEEEGIRVLVEKESLLKAVKMAAIFARESANIIKWSINSKGLVVSANSPQVGENKSVVEYEGEVTEEKDIAFNSRYLLDLLSHIDSKKIVFTMTEPLRPGVFYEEGNEKRFLHVIMPVRVQD